MCIHVVFQNLKQNFQTINCSKNIYIYAATHSSTVSVFNEKTDTKLNKFSKAFKILTRRISLTPLYLE